MICYNNECANSELTQYCSINAHTLTHSNAHLEVYHMIYKCQLQIQDQLTTAKLDSNQCAGLGLYPKCEMQMLKLTMHGDEISYQKSLIRKHESKLNVAGILNKAEKP